MAISRRYVPINVTVPPGTEPATPLMTNPELGDVWLYGLTLRIPPGHAGTTGFSIRLAGATLVPWESGPAWIIGDDDELPFDIGQETDQGLEIVTYNTDGIEHTFYCRFILVPISQVIRPATTPIIAIS